MKKIPSIDCRHFINGKYVDSNDKRTFENINPATEEVLGTVAEGGKTEVDYAVAAAKRALAGPWKNTTLVERSKMLRNIGDLILERQEELVHLESYDTGKPFWLANSIDIPRAAYNFHFFADYITSVGQEAYQQNQQALHYTHRKPVGVVGLIKPWNLPLLLLTWKLAPCIGMGNAAVVKPAEWTPMTATVLMEIIKDAGVPDGIVNLVHGFGPNSAGGAIAEHPDVDAISFIGEPRTGSSIMKAGADTIKKLSFELGGKNPNIIFADSDLDEVVETTIKSSFINQGEVCLCGSRIYVERNAFESFVKKFVERTKQLKVGNPFDETTNVGALISKEHYDRVNSYLDIAREDGANILTGGKRPEGMDTGYYLEPTIITGLDRNSRCVREEIFGPVVTITPFDMEEEVIMQANDTHYGLSATIWTNDLRRAHRVAHQIDAGIIWVNTWFLRDLRTPFGGMKHSGSGRAGGMHSIDFYSELSNITIKL
ncbi:aldehyde dehydrogenase [Gracilibacillus sp. YIM 98692]|uniref:aldehyde dehydrogenase n=1 Tax=Gracilibacillus sp. YIM 98692 TaxID=2663532 RepID=UPI0013D87A4B|nr:aldehyde dehydrogenase [Gracilibacillus sp. YIM 98692]